MCRRIAIVVAMEREIAPLLASWRRRNSVNHRVLRDRQESGTTFRCGNITVYCAGIGKAAARRAAETVVDGEAPGLMISAGVAGALTNALKVGDLVRPAEVVDAATGRSYATRDPGGSAVLVTADSVVSELDKKDMALRYQGQAVDMEAAAVAEVAQAAGVPFMAVKAISDPFDFPMPPLDQFITPEGKLDLLHLMGWASLRPRTWRALASLGRNSRKAAEELARELERVLAECSDEY